MAGGVRSLPLPDGGYRHIAILRLSSLGDVILTLPVVDTIAAAWPQARISYWVKEEFADVVRHHPGVQHVRELERDGRKIEDLVSMSAELEDCDLIVDLHGNVRSRLLTLRQPAPVLRTRRYRLQRARWVHARWSRPRPLPSALERYAETLAPLGLSAPGVPRVHVARDAEAWAGAAVSAWNVQGPLLALCPGAAHATKQWPLEHWLALDAALEAAQRARVYVSLDRERRALGALDAQVAASPIARWMCEPLPRIAAMLSHCDAAVTHDSGLMHLAAARGVRVVALFGSTSPVLGFAPSGAGHVVLCRNEPCQPCTLHGRASCPKGHFRCMRELRPGDVLAALESLRVAAGG